MPRFKKIEEPLDFLVGGVLNSLNKEEPIDWCSGPFSVTMTKCLCLYSNVKRKEIYLAHSYGDSRAWSWHQLNSSEDGIIML